MHPNTPLIRYNKCRTNNEVATNEGTSAYQPRCPG